MKATSFGRKIPAKDTDRRIPTEGYRQKYTDRRIPTEGYRQKDTGRRIPTEGYRHLPFYQNTRRRIPKIIVPIPFAVRAPSPARPLIILHPPPLATVTTGFTPFGASPFRISKGDFIIIGHHRLCRYKCS
jgi:hypothetical protein